MSYIDIIVDTLGQSSGECSICLEDLLQGNNILV